MAAVKPNASMVNENKTAECLYSKDQLKVSKKFANRKDLLESLLEDGKQYSVAKVEEMIEKFMKGKVN